MPSRPSVELGEKRGRQQSPTPIIYFQLRKRKSLSSSSLVSKAAPVAVKAPVALAILPVVLLLLLSVSVSVSSVTVAVQIFVVVSLQFRQYILSLLLIPSTALPLIVLHAIGGARKMGKILFTQLLNDTAGASSKLQSDSVTNRLKAAGRMGSSSPLLICTHKWPMVVLLSIRKIDGKGAGFPCLWPTSLDCYAMHETKGRHFMRANLLTQFLQRGRVELGSLLRWWQQLDRRVGGGISLGWWVWHLLKRVKLPKQNAERSTSDRIFFAIHPSSAPLNAKAT